MVAPWSVASQARKNFLLSLKEMSKTLPSSLFWETEAAVSPCLKGIPWWRCLMGILASCVWRTTLPPLWGFLLGDFVPWPKTCADYCESCLETLHSSSPWAWLLGAKIPFMGLAQGDCPESHMMDARGGCTGPNMWPLLMDCRLWLPIHCVLYSAFLLRFSSPFLSPQGPPHPLESLEDFSSLVAPGLQLFAKTKTTGTPFRVCWCGAEADIAEQVSVMQISQKS